MRMLSGLVAAAMLLWSSGAQASESNLCQDCLLGVYDDGAMTRTTGTISVFQIKSVYLGVRLSPGVRIDQLDFEAVYPPGFTVIDVHPYVSGATYDVGGNTAHVAWPTCVSGTRALFRVRVLTTTSVRNGIVQLRNSTGRACGTGAASSWLLPAGCYVLNPSGSAPPCATAVTAATWTIVKELFRDVDSR
jgi:hypothetical protein